MSYAGFLPAAAEELYRSILDDNPNLYIGLLTTRPDNFGVGAVELVADGYSRQACTEWTILTEEVGELPEGSLVFSNVHAVSFDPTWPDPIPAIVGWGLWDAETGGTLIATGKLESDESDGSPVMPGIDDEIRCAANKIYLIHAHGGALD